jgi:hypothetical protein
MDDLMFEFLINVMKDGMTDRAARNVRYPVDPKDIDEAEKRLGFKLPSQLRAFYEQIGCGFLRLPPNADDSRRLNYINRFLDPDEVATLYLGEDEDFDPSDGFDSTELPFFEVGDGLYIVIKMSGDDSNRVCWPSGEEISPDLVTFTRHLVEDPRFYHGKKS